MHRIIVPIVLLVFVVTGCGKESAPETSASKPAIAASKYTVIDSLDNAGSVQGTVSYKGTETDTSVKVTQDQTTCDPNGVGSIPTHSLRVQDGKLQNAVVYLSDISKGKSFSPREAMIDNKACVFEPRISVARKGDTLLLKNSDSVLHNANMVLKRGKTPKPLDNVPLTSRGATNTQRVKRTGLVDMKCNAHDWMQAYVYVTDHPYVVVTDSTGAFSLSDVPPGEYTLKAWHERLGFKSAKITVKATEPSTQDITYE